MQLAAKTKRTVGAAGGRLAKERMGAADSEDGRRRWPTVVAVVSLLAAGCGGSNSPTTNPDGGGNPDAGVGAITASIDGASWSSSAQHTVYYSNPVFNFLGSNGSRVITVTTVMVNGPGTYSLSYGNPTGSSAAVGNAAGGPSWGTVLPGGTGSITISTFTSNHAVGTFSFDAVPISGATNTLHITNGSFDLTF